MEIIMRYSLGFDFDELVALKKLEPTIHQSWLTNALSTSNLEWRFSIRNTEPCRIAVLVTVPSGIEVCRETLNSLRTKYIPQFEVDFMNSAKAYYDAKAGEASDEASV